MLATALHLPPAFSQSARVVNCANESADVPDDTPDEVPAPVDGLADGDVVALSPDELVDGAEAPGLVVLPEVSVEVLPLAPVVPEVPVLPAPELPVVPLGLLLPPAPAAPDVMPAPLVPPELA